MKIWVVFKREFWNYFSSPIASVFLFLFLLLTGYYFAEWLFYYGEAEMRPLFQLFPITFLFIVPAVSMRIWAEEKRSGTFELILTLPMSDGAVVWGKFLAAWAFLTIGILLTSPWVVVVNWLTLSPEEARALGPFVSTSLDIGPVIMGYIASIFLAGAYLAIGCYLSSLTKHQLVAFLTTAAFLGVLLFISQDIFLERIENSAPWLGKFFYHISLAPHFDSISKGVFDAKDFAYFISIIVIFLELNRFSVGYRD